MRNTRFTEHLFVRIWNITMCRDLKITTGMAVHIKTNEKKEMESLP